MTELKNEEINLTLTIHKLAPIGLELAGAVARELIEMGYHKQSENSIELPCKVGDTVYAAITPIDGADIEIAPCIEEWEVKGVCLEGDKWYAENSDGEFFEIGTDLCKLTREEAEQALAKVRGGE